MRKIVLMLLGLLVLAACGVAEPGVVSAPTPQLATAGPSPAASVPTAGPSPAASVPTAEPSPEPPRPGADGTSVRPPDALVQAAQQRLAAYLKRPAAQFELQSANQQEWPDAALGCPADGMSYLQAVTPGFRLVFTSDDQAQSYAVHTGTSASRLILCAGGQPIDLSPSGDSAEAHMADPALLDERGRAMLQLARAALARDLGIAEADVRLVTAEAIEWSDSSLGCSQPGQAAMQVITPGYRLVLGAQGRTYEYHTDRGKRLSRCDG